MEEAILHSVKNSVKKKKFWKGLPEEVTPELTTGHFREDDVCTGSKMIIYGSIC